MPAPSTPRDRSPDPRRVDRLLDPDPVPDGASGEEPAPGPLPHERDESADRDAPEGTAPSQREVGEGARRDLEEGREDTDRGPMADRVYERLKRGER